MLYHVYIMTDNNSEPYQVGIYSSRELALQAVKDFRDQYGESAGVITEVEIDQPVKIESPTIIVEETF